jgi:hypothetical protein
MNLSAYQLVSFEEEDQFINGIHFSLKRSQAIKIIEYFSSKNKWTEYYFHEIADYDLTTDQICSMLNIHEYWMNKKTMFFFQGYSIKKEQIEFKNSLVMLIQSYDKINNKPSHFYICWGNDEEIIEKNNFLIGSFLVEDELNKFANKHRIFDTNNFKYRLEKVSMKELYFDSSEIDSPIKLEPSPGFWDEEE